MSSIVVKTEKKKQKDKKQKRVDAEEEHSNSKRVKLDPHESTRISSIDFRALSLLINDTGLFGRANQTAVMGPINEFLCQSFDVWAYGFSRDVSKIVGGYLNPCILIIQLIPIKAIETGKSNPFLIVDLIDAIGSTGREQDVDNPHEMCVAALDWLCGDEFNPKSLPLSLCTFSETGMFLANSAYRPDSAFVTPLMAKFFLQTITGWRHEHVVTEVLYHMLWNPQMGKSASYQCIVSEYIYMKDWGKTLLLTAMIREWSLEAARAQSSGRFIWPAQIENALALLTTIKPVLDYDTFSLGSVGATVSRLESMLRVTNGLSCDASPHVCELYRPSLSFRIIFGYGHSDVYSANADSV